MSSKSPSVYKKKWFDHYDKLMKAKGLVFTERMFRRISYGFCYEEWKKDNRKIESVDTIFQYTYQELVYSLISSPPIFINKIKEIEPKVMLAPEFYKRPIKKVSHVQRWRFNGKEN
jgi:hypothetical protein